MDTQTLITAREFEEAAARLGSCELVRGEVQTLSPGGILHSQVAMKVGLIIGQWNQRAGLGRVLGCEMGLIVAREPDTVRAADVVYYSYERLPREVRGDSFSAVPPVLVVEVVGKGQGWQEMVAKAAECLRMGVDRVWIIDLRSQRLHVHSPDAEPRVLGRGETLADPSGLPGFSCQVDDFFAD